MLNNSVTTNTRWERKVTLKLSTPVNEWMDYYTNLIVSYPCWAPEACVFVHSCSHLLDDLCCHSQALVLCTTDLTISIHLFQPLTQPSLSVRVCTIAENSQLNCSFHLRKLYLQSFFLLQWISQHSYSSPYRVNFADGQVDFSTLAQMNKFKIKKKVFAFWQNLILPS